MRFSKGLLLGVMSIGLVACASTSDQTAPLDLENFFQTGGRDSSTDIDKVARDASKYDLGSEENPVRTSGVAGQHMYLKDLRCADGKAPSYRRLGNGGPGVYGSIVDIYNVECAGSEPAESVIWMDLYHPGYKDTWT